MKSPLVLAAALIPLALTQPASASPEVREKLAELAQRVLDTVNNQPISVGVFSPTDLPHTNSGPGLEQILANELDHLKAGIVQADANFEVKGDYAYARSRDPSLEGFKVIKINVRIIEKEFSETLLALEVTLDHTRTVAEIVQFHGAISPDGSKRERNEELDRIHADSSVHIHGTNDTLVSSTAASPFAVETLTKPVHGQTTAAPRPARVEENMAYVDINRGEIYEVKIHNNSDHDIAVALSVDGLDVFHFTIDEHRDEHGVPTFTHFIVGPNSTTPIVGWFQKLAPPDNYLSFLVTGYGQGAVSRAGIRARGQVGVIHVQFSKCYPLPPGARSRSGNETGFGPPRSVDQEAVRYEIEPPHDFAAIRYAR